MMLWAPEWDKGMVLSHQGRWHYRIGLANGLTRCGVYGYTTSTIPKGAITSYRARLERIARGLESAPMCKTCEKRGRP